MLTSMTTRRETLRSLNAPKAPDHCGVSAAGTLSGLGTQPEDQPSYLLRLYKGCCPKLGAWIVGAGSVVVQPFCRNPCVGAASQALAGTAT